MYTRPFQFESRTALLNNLNKNYVGKFKLVDNFPELISQKGSTCKLVAIMNAMTYHYVTGNLTQAPLPLFKSKKKLISARQIAKQKAKSSVGEMYTEKMILEFIKGLGEANKDNNLIDAKVEFHRFKDTKSYIDLLVKTIDANNNVPLVFFDVAINPDPEGLPSRYGKGNQEHCAIVIGYCHDKENKVFLIIGQWENYYIVNGKDLAIAASHLVDQHSPATFYKVKNNVKSTEWTPNMGDLITYLPSIDFKKLEHKDNVEFLHENKKHILYKRLGYKNTEKAPGFKSTICLITPRKNDMKDEIIIQKFDSNLYKLPSVAIDSIAKIEKECFAPGMCNTTMDNYIHRFGYQLLIAKSNNEIVGTLFFKIQSNTLYVQNLIIKNDFQGNGIGTLLMNKIIEEGRLLKLDIYLESLPRNQVYYEKFGFKVAKKIGRTYWTALDDKQEKYSIRQLPMKLTISESILRPTLPKLGKTDEKQDVLWSKKPENIEKIKAVKNLATFAKNKTSFMYGIPIRNKTKEAAFSAIEEELAIHLSTIQQKTVLTEKILASIIIAILKNSMIVRGLGIRDEKTSSGKKTFSLLRGTSQSPLVNNAHIHIINTMLSKYYFDISKCNSYEALRFKLFGSKNYFSHTHTNPYHYYEGPMELKKPLNSFKTKLKPIDIQLSRVFK